MRTILLIFSCLLISANVYAHQPASIEAKYDPDAKSIHIKIDHTTQNRKVDYVRRIVVLLNDQQVSSRNFFFQSNNTGMELDLPLQADPEDQIEIKAYSETGGMLQQSFAVSEITENEEEPDMSGK